MPLIIPDETLEAMKLTEREARIEIAVRLYDADVLNAPQAVRLSGLDRISFAGACGERNVDYYRYTEDSLEQDLKTLGMIRGEHAAGRE